MNLRFLIIVINLLSFQALARLTMSQLAENPSLLLSSNSNDIRDFAKTLPTEAQNKMNNFALIKDKLAECFSDKDDARGIQNALLSGASSDSCIIKNTGGKTARQISFDFGEIKDALNFVAIKDLVQKNSIENAARVVFDYRTKFEGATPLPKENDEKGMSQLLFKVCKTCTKEQKEIFKNKIKSMRTEEVNDHELSKYSINELTSVINADVKELNEKIKTMEDAKNTDNEEQFKSAYDDYLKTYQNLTSKPAGALVLTNHIRAFTGGVLTPDDANQMFLIAGKTRFPKHKPINDRISCVNNSNIKNSQRCLSTAKTNISLALGEIESKVGDFTKSILDANNFEDLLKSDPAMAGQMLVVNPKLVSNICTAADNVIKSDTNTKKNLKTAEGFLNVVDTASLGLLALGGGGYLIKGVLSLGKIGVRAVGSAVLTNTNIASQIMTGSMITGSGSQALHVVVDSSHLTHLSGMSDEIKASRMANASSSVDMKRISAIEEQWNKSMSNLLIASATNASLVTGIMKIRSSPFMESILKGRKDLKNIETIENGFRKLLDGISDSEIKQISKIIKDQNINADDLSAALLAVSNNPNGKERFLELLRKNPGRTIKDLAEAAKEASVCTIK